MSAAAAALGVTDSGIELVIPKAAPGIGKVILSPTSADLIAGVEIAPLSLWPDDRGYFLEVARLGQGLVAGFPGKGSQVSAALNYPGIIKAFHYHKLQTDYWVPAAGLLQVALVDLRSNSATFGKKNTLLCGRAAAVANVDSAGRGARLQGDWRAAFGVGVHHQSHLRSERRRPHRA